MPTAKRERKRAGRQARLAQIEAARRRAQLRKRALVGVIVAAVAVGVIYVFNRGPASPAKRAVTTAGGCPAVNGSSPRRTSFTQPPPTCIQPGRTYTATFTTDVGTFTATLDAKTAPVTVNDFVVLARYHFYDGLSFHRVIPGFVIQGGDPNPPTSATSAPSGPQGPGYSVRGEAPKAGAYKVGSLAMAKTQGEPPGTASSQFFIVTGPQGVALPPQYSLFGQVTSGLGVVKKIEAAGTPSGQPKVVHKMLKVTISSS